MAKERGPLVEPQKFAEPRKKYDKDWRERIEIAKQEREAAQKAREGKPATFSRRRG